MADQHRLFYVIMYHLPPWVHEATRGGRQLLKLADSEASGVGWLTNIARGFVTLVFGYAGKR